MCGGVRVGCVFVKQDGGGNGAPHLTHAVVEIQYIMASWKFY